MCLRIWHRRIEKLTHACVHVIYDWVVKWLLRYVDNELLVLDSQKLHLKLMRCLNNVAHLLRNENSRYMQTCYTYFAGCPNH